MNFLDPTALYYLAAALPAITALYFLKLRRQEQVVSSTLLWKRSVYDLRVNAPIQMIRRNLLLLLQLIIATLVILALARPFVQVSRGQGRAAALVIDCSASMGTRDVNGKTRLEAAKAEALKLVDALGIKGKGASQNDELCVIAAADRPVPVCELTSDKARLRKAINRIRLKQSRTDMAAALEMAVALTGVGRTVRDLERGEEIKADAKPAAPKDDKDMRREEEPGNTKATVIILSDGAFHPIGRRLADKLKGSERDAGGAVGEGSRFIQLGRERSDNLAIVSLDLRKSSLETGGRQLFVRVENMSNRRKTASLELRLDGEFMDSKDLVIPPRADVRSGENEVMRVAGQRGVVFDLPSDAQGVLKVQLSPDDSLNIDNRAYAVLRTAQPIRALLVTAGNFYLANALSADQRNLRFDSMLPGEYPESGIPKNREGDNYDLFIFDRFAPKQVPLGASFFVGVVPDLPGITEDKEHSPLFTPTVVDWKRTHPMMHNLRLLRKLFIYESLRLKLSGSWASIIDGQGVYAASIEDLKDDDKLAAAPEMECPLLCGLLTEDRRVAVLAFSVLKTERWVMRISFPLFIRNVTHWLARPGGMQQAVAFHTGETIRMKFTNDIAAVTVKTPGGGTRSAPLAGKRSAYFSDTYEVGVYHVEAEGGRSKIYAVNLLSSTESDNAAQKNITLGEERLGATRGPARRNSDLWPWFALLALLFLIVEWYVYNRRILG